VNLEGSILLQAAAGIGLASAAGLRAFLPMLVVGVAARIGWVQLGSTYDWLGSWPALVTIGIAVVVELAADKVPVVDHVLDVLQIWIKPVIGTLLAASVCTDVRPLQALLLGATLGGGTAAVIHVAKAKARLVSSVSTAGAANPILSSVEDVVSFFVAVIAVLIPILVLGVVALVVVALVALARRQRHARSHRSPES
jgi:uncharacterized membrane protein